jgi:hypothetical protein
MNRLNQTEPAIFSYLSCSVAFKVPFSSILSKMFSLTEYQDSNVVVFLFAYIACLPTLGHTWFQALLTPEIWCTNLTGATPQILQVCVVLKH